MSVRICIVGMGLAADIHVRAIRASMPQARISVVGRDFGRAQLWARERSLDCAWRSLDEALSSDVGVVVIATPPTTHTTILDAVMAADKHVLLEKPAVRTLGDLTARLPAIRAYRRAWMVAENAHFSPLHRTILTRLQAGDLGVPLVVSLRRLRARPPGARWKWSSAETDGALHEGGVHCIRCALALLGVARPADIEWVFAATPGKKLLENDGDDTALVTWRTRDGALGELWHSWALEGGRAPLRSTVVGTTGVVHFDVLGRFAAVSRGRRWPPRPLLPWRALRKGEDLGGTEEMWRSYLTSVQTGAPVAHTIDEAHADLAVIDAAYRSMRSGRVEACLS